MILLSSCLVCLRMSIPWLCQWLLCSSSKPIDALTTELKSVTRELASISQQDQFATYARKDRQRQALIQRVKDERQALENKESQVISRIRWVVNLLTILLFGWIGRQPILFNFPLIIWLAALNTFLSSSADLLRRFRENKTSQD